MSSDTNAPKAELGQSWPSRKNKDPVPGVQGGVKKAASQPRSRAC